MTLHIDRPLQRLDHLAQVLAHGGLARVRIAGRQGFDDLFVLNESLPKPKK